MELSKATTVVLLHVSEIALFAFGMLLVIGLVGEYREDWKKHLKIFELFVIVGVAGELLSDGGIFLFSGHLQTISDLEVAELNKSAARALSAASKANKETARLNSKILDGEIELAKEGLELARAKTKLAEIELKQLPRTVLPGQREKLLRALAPHPKGKIFVKFISEPEPHSFAEDIAEALNSIGFDVEFSDSGIIAPIPHGVFLKSGKEQSPRLDALVKALNDSNIEFTRQLIDGWTDRIEILVGRKTGL